VLEPSGAVALASVIAGRIPNQARTIAVICSGGNVEADMFSRALGGAS
jgi:threonine dehydratase